MKTFANKNPQTLEQAVSLVQQARKDGQTPSVVGGGSDLLGMVKEFLIKPDVLVNLKTIKGLDQVAPTAGGVNIGGLITLDTLGSHPLIRSQYSVLAEAAETVATPQIRNVGTLGRQRLPASLVLVFPQWFSVPQEWRRHLFFHCGR